MTLVSRLVNVSFAAAGLDYTVTEVEGAFRGENTVTAVIVAIIQDHPTEEAENFIALLSSSAPDVMIGSEKTAYQSIGRCSM